MPLDIAPWQQTVAQYKQQFAFSYGEHCGEQLINPLWLLNSISHKKHRKLSSSPMWDNIKCGRHYTCNITHQKTSSPPPVSVLWASAYLPLSMRKKALPQDEVILVSGDGSIIMNIQELGSIGRGKAPIKIVLLDNQRLGMVRQWQSLFFNERHSSTILDDNPDFVVLTSAFGIKGERIDSAHQVDAALERLFNSQEAYLLHICIHSDENV